MRPLRAACQLATAEKIRNMIATGTARYKYSIYISCGEVFVQAIFLLFGIIRLYTHFFKG